MLVGAADPADGPADVATAGLPPQTSDSQAAVADSNTLVPAGIGIMALLMAAFATATIRRHRKADARASI